MDKGRSYLLLGLLLLAAYANSFTSGFVIDNKILILDDPRVQALSWENLSAIFSKDYWWPGAVVGVYRPVAKLTYLLNYVLPGGGANPVGYHIINLLLQWGNAILVFLLLRRLSGNRAMALTGAALFALHPLATEAVTNIVGRTDLIAGMAILGALLCFIRALETTDKQKLGWLAAMSAISAIGMLTKENAVGVVAVVGLYALAFVPRERWWREGLATALALTPAYLGVWVLRHWVAAQGMPPQFPFVDNPLVAADFLTARLTAIKVMAHYAVLLVWPARLSCDYSYNQIPLASWNDPAVWAGVAILGLLAALLVIWHRRNKMLFFLAGSALLVMLPTSNLFFNIGNIMGERYLYVSLIGFSGCVAAGLACLPKRIWMALAAVLLVAFGARSFVRNFDWHDTLTIWTSAAQACPNSTKAIKAYAAAIHERDPQYRSLDQVIGIAGQAIRIMEKPPIPVLHQFGSLYADLGAYWVERGEGLDGTTNLTDRTAAYRTAIIYLTRAIAVEEATATNLLHQAISKGQDTTDMLRGFGDYHPYGNLALALMRLGNNEKALHVYAKMHSLAPSETKGYLGAALAHEALKERDQALTCLLQALLLDNSNQSYWNTVFAAYSRFGLADEALIKTGGRPQLNLTAPLVRHHLKQAYINLARNFDESGNTAMALSLREQAAQEGL